MRKDLAILVAATFLLAAGALRADDGADKLTAQKKAAEENWALLDAGDAATVETAHLLMYAPKSMEKKLKDIGGALEKQQAKAREALGYDEKSEPWPGKLTVYLFPERDTFTRFVRKVENRRVEADDTGSHFADSDIPHAAAGPAKKRKDYTLEDQAAEQVASALLQRKAGKDTVLPGWLLSGFGRATVYRVSGKDNAMVKKERVWAAKLSAAKSARDVWAGTLEGEESAILEASVTDFLAYGPYSAKFSKFVTGFKPDENLNPKTAAQAIEAAGWIADGVDKDWKRWVVNPK